MSMNIEIYQTSEAIIVKFTHGTLSSWGKFNLLETLRNKIPCVILFVREYKTGIAIGFVCVVRNVLISSFGKINKKFFKSQTHTLTNKHCSRTLPLSVCLVKFGSRSLHIFLCLLVEMKATQLQFPLLHFRTICMLAGGGRQTRTFFYLIKASTETCELLIFQFSGTILNWI